VTGTLFLAHRLPFPPDRGDKIRSHNVLKALARLGPVHVGSFAENPADLANVVELDGLAASHCVPLRDKPLPLAGLEALYRREPVSLAAVRHARLAQWVQELLASGQIDAIYVFSGQMGQYVPHDWAGRLVVDLVDVDSAKFDQYSAGQNGLMRWVHSREGRLLRVEEARLAARADRTLLISAAEADLLRSRLPSGHPARIAVMGNGIDAAAFDPAKVQPQPRMGPGPHLVFTGQMDYPPNVEAALVAIGSILPRVRQRYPQAQLHIVGRAPVTELLAHDGMDGCRVWGEVPDVRPFLAVADAVVVPLELARGVQNKVLEAMAMARAVVLTPQAATGIPATYGAHFIVAQGVEPFADAVIDLIAVPERAAALGEAARDFVLDRMSWPAMVAGLPALMGHD